MKSYTQTSAGVKVSTRKPVIIAVIAATVLLTAFIAANTTPVAIAAPATPATTPATPTATPAIPTNISASRPVASVNGEIIPARKLNDMMIRTWGYEAVNQLIGDTLVMQAAIKAGIQISEQDIADEQAITLSAIFPQIGDASPDAVLAEILRVRKVPRHLWNVTMRRNAILRKLAKKRIMITDEMLTDAFNNRYGLKVRIRHIQCASMADAQKVYALIQNGADFAETAKKYSINSDSAQDGGLVAQAFSRDDKNIPAIIRQTAFSLADGKISDILQEDRFYHIIRREQTIAPEKGVKFEQVRDQLKNELTQELVRVIQARILDELRLEADIVLLDPILKEQAIQSETRQ